MLRSIEPLDQPDPTTSVSLRPQRLGGERGEHGRMLEEEVFQKPTFLTIMRFGSGCGPGSGSQPGSRGEVAQWRSCRKRTSTPMTVLISRFWTTTARRVA